MGVGGYTIKDYVLSQGGGGPRHPQNGLRNFLMFPKIHATKKNNLKKRLVTTRLSNLLAKYSKVFVLKDYALKSTLPTYLYLDLNLSFITKVFPI